MLDYEGERKKKKGEIVKRKEEKKEGRKERRKDERKE